MANEFQIELQTVILAAGRGSRISQLVNGKPKCLLSVANKPMIQYVLELLIKNGIDDAIIVVFENEKELIKSAINNIDLSIRLNYVSISHADDYGTADSIRSIKNLIKKDMLLLSCDLVADINLWPMIEQYRLSNATFMCLLCQNKLSNKENLVPANRFQVNKEFDYVGLSDQDGHSKLVLFEPDVMFTEWLPLKRTLLKSCSQFTLHMDLMDTHLYIIRRWILDYLNYKMDIRSIKLDLLPSLVRKQFRPFKHESVTSRQIYDLEQLAQAANKSICDFMETPQIQHYLNDIDQAGQITQWPLSCVAFTLRLEPSGYCFRVNNLQSFCQANRVLCEKLTQHVQPHGRSQIDQKSQLKQNVIGQNCNIGSSVKLTNCILQDNVKIENGCQLSNSLICQDVIIGANAQLDNCMVGPGQKVAAQARYKNESLLEEIFNF